MALDALAGTVSGLEFLDGKQVNDNAAAYRGRLLFPDREVTVRITVRKDQVLCTCDGVKVVDWRGNLGKLSLPPEFKVPDTKAPFLATMGSRVAVREISLMEPGRIDDAANPQTILDGNDAQAARGTARVAVPGCQPAALDGSGLWTEIPVTVLRGATVYEPRLEGTAPEQHVVEFEVLESGIVTLAAAWSHEGTRVGDWLKDRIERDDLLKGGWLPIATMMHSSPGGRRDAQFVFRRQVTKGEKFRLATRGLTPPFIIVPAAKEAAALLSATPYQVRLPGDANDSVGNVAVSPDGTRVAMLHTSGRLQLFDRDTMSEIAAWQAHGKSDECPYLLFSPDSKLLITAGVVDKLVKLWDVSDQSEIATLGPQRLFISSLAVSADGRKVAISGSSVYEGGGEIRLWDVEKHDKPTIITCDQGVCCVAFAPDGKHLAASEVPRDLDDGVHAAVTSVWEIETRQVRARFGTRPASCTDCNLLPDGELLAIAEYGGPRPLQMSHRIRLVDPETGDERGVLVGHTNMVAALAFSPDGKHLVANSADNTMRIWNVADRHEVGNRHDDFTYHDRGAQLTFTSDGRAFATSGRNASIWGIEGVPTWLHEDETPFLQRPSLHEVKS